MNHLQKYRRWVMPASLAAVFLGILVLELGSYFILGAEGRDLHANIHTPSDALWWSIVTIATVGYGDKYPVTNEGRVIGVLVIITGVGLFGVFTGFLANTFINRRKRRRRFGFQPMPMSADPLEEIRQLLEQQSLRLASIESRLPPAPPTASASTDGPPT
jgi:voltage-gated potassium channel